MSLRRSARTQAQVVPELPNGRVAEMANQSKKRGRKSEAAEDVASSAVAQDGTSASTVAKSDLMPPPPATPDNKRRKIAKSEKKPPPFTPTPSAIGLMISRSNESTGDIDDKTHSSRELRPVAYNQTNATLVTPGGTQLQPTFKDSEESPSKPAARPQTTTVTLLQEACAHLINVDPTLQPLVERFQCRMFTPEGLAEEIDPFVSLASGIMSQQVTGAAASSIKKKFIALFPSEACPRGFPLPSIVAKTAIPRLREAGLSLRKAEYIQGLAEKFDAGELSAKMLMEGSDEEVMKSLVAVRGLGAWSVEMFMCFGLKRMDIFSTGDLGVQRGMAAHAGRDVKKLKNKGANNKWKYMSEKDMLEISAKFSPYRSLFMWYMWRVEDVDTVAMESISTLE